MCLHLLTFLCSGETPYNRINKLQGHTDVPLNENGRRQAARAAPTTTVMTTKNVALAHVGLVTESIGGFRTSSACVKSRAEATGSA